MKTAITRGVSDAIAHCELTHLDRTPIDVGRARAQHAQYEGALEALGYRLIRLPADPALPDCVFVEDTALVLDEVAVLTRPGAPSRRPELAAIEAALAPHRPLLRLEAPAILDGGDVLRVGRTLYVGQTPRTSAEGTAALASLLSPHGYHVVPVAVSGCLHLKTGVSQVAADALLINRGWVDARAFPGLRLIDVDPAEPTGANSLLSGDTVLYPAAYPRTLACLEGEGLRVATVPADELAKAEGGLTCCSLLFDA